MPITVKVTSITFSDGTKIELPGADRVVLVGPNNAGKSAALGNILNACAGNALGPVIRELELTKNAEGDDLAAFLKDNFVQVATGQFLAPGGMTGTIEYFQRQFANSKNLGRILPLFVSILNATGRIESSMSVPTIDFYNQAKAHPLHYLHQDPELRRKLATWFRRAFGTGIAMDFMAGARIPLHVGDDVELHAGETALDRPYVDRLRSFPRLEKGDGVRSFVGCCSMCC